MHNLMEKLKEMNSDVKYMVGNQYLLGIQMPTKKKAASIKYAIADEMAEKLLNGTGVALVVVIPEEDMRKALGAQDHHKLKTPGME